MIIVKIKGGLGNQLFQYAFGLYLKNSLNSEVFYCIDVDKKNKNLTKRELGISKFNFTLKTVDYKSVERYKLFDSGILDRIEHKLHRLFPILNYNGYVVEPTNHEMISTKFIRNNCFYDGYWQNLNYLKSNNQSLIENLKLKDGIKDENTFNKIKSVENNSVSIHVRRGDYISIKKNADIFSISSIDYYKKAIEIIEKKITNPEYFIFSDDIEWCKLNFKVGNFHFITGNSAEQDLLLMSKCRHNIIANSTFSWWAAWLNNYENKIVIAPYNWYVDSKLNKRLNGDFILDNWLQI